MSSNVEGLFDLRSLGINIYCDTEEKISSVLAYKDGTSNFFFPISTIYDSLELRGNTTYWHECRHFHDHLLSPYLNYLYRMRLLGVLHATQFVNGWNNQNYFNTIPVPLTKWIKKRKKRKKSSYFPNKKKLC